MTPLVIVNPVAGRSRGAKLRQTALAFLKSQTAGDVVETRAPGHATELASSAAAAGRETVLVVGGDGTWREAAAGLAGTPTALGLIPVGSGNDLCRTLEIPRDIRAACRVALAGNPRRLDAVRLQATGLDTIFINAAGFGFDAAVVAEATKLKRLRGLPLYLAAVMRAVRNYDCPETVVQTPEQEWRKPLLLVAAANGKFYGGGMKMAPAAEPDDGRLEICIIDAASRWRIYQCLPRFVSGTHLGLPEVTMVRSRSVVIETHAGMPVQLDGDLLDSGGATRYELTVLPGALTVRA
uniref:Diacylglycerol kinase family lipid kinase n=1 Tax=candidate division WOR-3 bacterium TaxID=2052148 RepID=A0A7C4G9F9_UNCW3